jgi:hypothetical protein
MDWVKLGLRAFPLGMGGRGPLLVLGVRSRGDKVPEGSYGVFG